MLLYILIYRCISLLDANNIEFTNDKNILNLFIKLKNLLILNRFLGCFLEISIILFKSLLFYTCIIVDFLLVIQYCILNQLKWSSLTLIFIMLPLFMLIIVNISFKIDKLIAKWNQMAYSFIFLSILSTVFQLDMILW